MSCLQYVYVQVRGLLRAADNPIFPGDLGVVPGVASSSRAGGVGLEGMGVDDVARDMDVSAQSPPPPTRGRERESQSRVRRGARRRVGSNVDGGVPGAVDLELRMAGMAVRSEGGHCPVRGCYCAQGMGHLPSKHILIHTCWV